MRNIFKSIFRPSRRSVRERQQSQNILSQEEEIAQLLSVLRDKLGGDGQSKGISDLVNKLGLDSGRDQGVSERLSEALAGLEAREQANGTTGGQFADAPPGSDGTHSAGPPVANPLIRSRHKAVSSASVSVSDSDLSSPTASPGTLSPVVSPTLTPTPSSDTSLDANGQEPAFRSYDAADLQAAFGTGQKANSSHDDSSRPLPALSSYRATVAPAAKRAPPPSPTDSSGSEQSIWEYRGQQLTRSALDLVLRQEALAQADSSGQYAGEVSWDDLRNAWIPKWVQKLKESDLAEGEIPDTTPAGFVEKETDEWGNKIGWYGPHKEMFYLEEPSFELRDD